MISLIVVFWMYVILLAAVGAMRGWAKELLVSFSVVLCLALNHVLKKYIPLVSMLPVVPAEGTTPYLFWIRASVLAGLVYFGYQTVVSIPHLAGKATRERLADTLFGLVMGAFNGYLIVGTVWFYLHEAQYPFPNIIEAPRGDLLKVVERMMAFMPPRLLGEPWIYFAVILAFVFVLVVFI